IKFTNGLSGERFAINEEKNAPNKFRFQQSINLRDREIGFASAGRHREHHVMLAAQDGFFHRNNAFPLIWSKLGDLLRWRIKQITLSGRRDVGKARFESRGSVEIAKLPRTESFRSCIDMPDNRSVACVKERHA